MRQTWPHATLSALTLPLLLVAACDSGSTGPTQPGQPVEMQLTAAVPAASAGVPTPLEVTSLRMVFGAADLGANNECDNCGGDDGEDAEPAPSLVAIPTDGRSVPIQAGDVRPGHYTRAELDLVRPSSDILRANPGWPPQATIAVAGRFRGTPFSVTFAIEGELRAALAQPVDVATASPGTIAITVTLPVASWLTANGAALDPNDPAQRAQIEANIRRDVASRAGED